MTTRSFPLIAATLTLGAVTTPVQSLPAVRASVVDTVATNASSAINAKAGQLFVVGLDANPTTGYSWSHGSR